MPSKTKPKLEFEALGTHWDIECPAGISGRLEREIQSTLERIDKTWSRFRDDSVVATMSRQADTYKLETPDYALLMWYRKLYDATAGSVTPLIGQTLSDAGYDAAYSLQPKATIHRTPSWESRLQLRDHELEILKPTSLDVGAAGKGFAIDQVATLLGDTYLMDAGGDIRTQGQTHIIGLEHPYQPGTVIGTATVSGQSICGSAGNRRTWANGTWHHIIDPKTSSPTTNVLATWAIADSAMIADGLATALFFVAPEKLKHLAKFHYIVMYMDGSVRYSPNAQLKLFS